eukprot:1845640-Ditylum_brightwellii.AAC.1
MERKCLVFCLCVAHWINTLTDIVKMRLRFNDCVFWALLGSEGGDLDQITIAAICSARKRREEIHKEIPCSSLFISVEDALLSGDTSALITAT